MLALLRGELSDTDAQILITLGAAFLAGSAAVAGVAAGGAARAVTATAPVWFAVIAAWIWSDFEGELSSRLAATSAVALITGVLFATHALLLRDRRLRAAWVPLALAAALTLVVVWADDPSDWLGRVTAAAWVLAILGWLLTPVLQRLAAGDEGGLVEVHAEGGRLVVRTAEGEQRLDEGETLVLRRP